METLTNIQTHANAKRIDEKLSDISADSGYETAIMETPPGASDTSRSSLSGSKTEQQISFHEKLAHGNAGQKKEEYVNGLSQRLAQMENELKALRTKQ